MSSDAINADRRLLAISGVMLVSSAILLGYGFVFESGISSLQFMVVATFLFLVGQFTILIELAEVALKTFGDITGTNLLEEIENDLEATQKTGNVAALGGMMEEMMDEMTDETSDEQKG